MRGRRRWTVAEASRRLSRLVAGINSSITESVALTRPPDVLARSLWQTRRHGGNRPRFPPLPLRLLVSSLPHVLLEARRLATQLLRVMHHLLKLLRLWHFPRRPAILDEAVVSFERGEGRAGESDNLMYEVLRVLFRQEVRDETNGSCRTQVELRSDGDEVGGEESDVDSREDLKLRSRLVRTAPSA